MNVSLSIFSTVETFNRKSYQEGNHGHCSFVKIDIGVYARSTSVVSKGTSSEDGYKL